MVEIDPKWLGGMKARLALLKPGTIWKNAKGHQVYIDAVSTNLLRTDHAFSYVDYYDELGLKTCKKSDFVAQYRYLGKARLLRQELCSNRNLALPQVSRVKA